jgi:hypothetical protein
MLRPVVLVRLGGWEWLAGTDEANGRLGIALPGGQHPDPAPRQTHDEVVTAGRGISTSTPSIG